MLCAASVKYLCQVSRHIQATVDDDPVQESVAAKVVPPAEPSFHGFAKNNRETQLAEGCARGAAVRSHEAARRILPVVEVVGRRFIVYLPALRVQGSREVGFVEAEPTAVSRRRRRSGPPC